MSPSLVMEEASFSRAQFSIGDNGVIWNATGDAVEPRGWTYRINTNISSVDRVVSAYLESEVGEFAIDCGSQTCLLYLATLMEAFKGLIALRCLERQDAIVSAAILRTGEFDPHLRLNKFLPFNEVSKDEWGAFDLETGDFVTWGPGAHCGVILDPDDLTVFDSLCTDVADDPDEAFRLDVDEFLLRFGTT